MSIKATNHGGGITFRIAECDCGERWELEERRARRLPPCTAVHSRGQPPKAASPSESSGGFGGDLSAVPERIEDPNTNSTLLGKPRARTRTKEHAEYPLSFEEVWVGTGKRGVKHNGHKAWVSQGKPLWVSIKPVWEAYMRSDRPSRGFVKDLSSWLNGRCHLQEWQPAQVAPIRRIDPAVRAREEAEDAALERRAELAFGRTV